MYTVALAARICERLTNGESLRSICRSDDMPAASTVFLWLLKDQKFSEQYEKSRQAGVHAMLEDIIEIADNAVPYQGRVDKEKLMCDVRKWAMSKLLPKKYGEAVLLKGDKDNPLQLAGVIVVPKKDVATASPVAAKPKAG